MNKLQRIEKLEEQRRRVSTALTGDDAMGRILAKLKRLADRRPPSEPAPPVSAAETQAHIAQLKATVQAGLAHMKEVQKQPKSPAWLKLQHKAY